MRFLRKSLLGLFLLSLTLALFAYAGLLVSNAVQARMSEEPRVPRARERVFAVNVLTVAFETVTPELSVFGEIQSRRTLELRAAAGGALGDLAPEFVEGGRVTAGQVLGRVDPADAQAALSRAQSDLLDAQAEQREAERAIVLARDELAAAQEQAALREKALKRQNDLVARSVGTAAAVEDAELALSSARQAILTKRQSVASAEARIDQAVTKLQRAEIARDEAQRRLDETEIKAGFAGTLSDVTVVAGRLVSQNEKLASLVDLEQLETAFRVSTVQFARLLDAQGQLRPADVRVTLDAAGVEIVAKGTLSRAGAAVGEGQTGRLLFASLDQAPGFKPGDFVTVTLAEPELRFVARVPATAVDAGGTVLVVGDDGRLSSVAVQVLRRQRDDVLIRGEGLNGATIVVERTPLLGDGIKVQPVAPVAPGAEVVAQAPQTVVLSAERRAKLVAFVEANNRMPAEAKSRVLSQLQQDEVPMRVVERLESRMGG